MASKRKVSEMRLRAASWERFLRGPDVRLVDQLYVPALSRAIRYDRCCAYFSSRVLAVAARGFGRFIENLIHLGNKASRPAARLLVNEQLDRADLSALLATGDQSKLITKLLKQFKTPQDAIEKNRLEMLAWLVASGLLEVRVGLMRRTPGIVHAKFGVVTDGRNDSLVFMGSDNETGEALTENYEELELRTSWQDKEFTDYYRDRFAALWEDRDEHVMTLPLPEAVRLAVIKLAPEKPPAELTHDKAGMSAAMQWHFIAAAPYLPKGETACDATALIDLWPHQRRVVEDTSSAFPAGRLVCDEVGMGKTIEALLILRRLLCGRGVKRALLLVPAGLLRQWQEELREKGGLLVPRWEDDYLGWPNGERTRMAARDALAENDVILLSREWARLENNREVVLAAPVWDLVLLDEAHAARRSSPEEREFNSGNLLLTLMRELQFRWRARGIVLLSGTPMQTQPWEPWDLLSVLSVGGEWMVDFADIRAYYQAVKKLRTGPLDKDTAGTVARLVLRDGGFTDPPKGLGTTDANTLRRSLMFTQGAECSEWLRRNTPLARRMHRNTRDTLRKYYDRGLLESPPARRDLRDEVFDYQQQAERNCYESVGRYIDKRYDELEHEKPGKGFVMTIYRRRAASSPLALRRSLERRRDGLTKVINKQWVDTWEAPESEEIARDLSDIGIDERVDPALPSSPRIAAAEKKEIADLFQELDGLGGADSKFDKFWSVLQEITADGRSVLVFTEYGDTLEYLRDRLRPMLGSTLGCYSGEGGQVWAGQSWQRVTKAEIAERLNRGELTILVCTDAASEGLNLQAASALVNYDLPWNPSKVEQRIGRIDRIGQQQSVLPIRNLFLIHSVDMQVYQALRERCGLFEHFVGRMQPVLALAREALRKNLKPSEAASLIRDLRKVAESVEADDAVANAFASAEAEALDTSPPALTRQDIEAALAELGSIGGRLQATQEKGRAVWRLRGLGKRNVRVTTDSGVLELDRSAVPVTTGAPILERILERVPLPSQVPLILTEHIDGPYCCREARWVTADGIVPIASMAKLKELIESWDGNLPPPGLLAQAREEARNAARQRVKRLVHHAHTVQQHNVRQQAESCRRRLLRELGRNLRCLGLGDLNALLDDQVSRESNPEGRYHRALRLLGGFPNWSPDDVHEAERFVSRLSARERQARINLASELEAALNDPRWRAQATDGWPRLG